MEATLIAAALVVLAVLGIVWTIVLASLVGELKRGSQRLDGVLQALQADLPSTLAEVREAARSVANVTQKVGEAAPHLQATLGALEEAGENVRGVTAAVRSVFGYRLIPVAGILAGLRTGLRYAWRIYRRRES
jgi:uncharacterized protein YoxC